VGTSLSLIAQSCTRSWRLYLWYTYSLISRPWNFRRLGNKKLFLWARG